MARSIGVRMVRVGGIAASGALLLVAGAAVVQLALAGLIRTEETVAEFWYTVYTGARVSVPIALSIIVVLAALHLAWHGREDIRPRGPDDVLDWWSLGERLLHWSLVLAFAVLLVTGLQLYLAGPGLPSPLTRTMRAWHVGEPFMVLGGLLFLCWHRDAIPRRYDWHWLARGGGYIHRGERLPAGRFNAGQKAWFWLEAATGLVMALTGLHLERVSSFDAGYLTLIGLHLGAAAVFLVVLAVHFYLAVVGVRGALGGMVHGHISRAGAARLHSEAAAVSKDPQRP